MANEGGGFASSGEDREDGEQMDEWSDFEKWKNK
jgi:hypothetical protein